KRPDSRVIRMKVEDWSQKVVVEGLTVGLVFPSYSAWTVGCNPIRVTCPSWYFTTREWADLPHPDPPNYPSPVSERDLSFEVTSTARLAPSSTTSPGVASGTFKIILP